MDMSDILDRGDLQVLVTALGTHPEWVDAPVTLSDHQAHPIHALCDRVFDGRLTEVQALPLARALVDRGANLHHVHATNGDGLVASAISLSCPTLAGMLIDAGAPTTQPGLFAATPLYWAAIMGMPALVRRLVPGADLQRKDAEFASTPLGWAIEGWASPPKGSKGGQIECAHLLVAAGSVVEPQWIASERIKADTAMRTALNL